MNNADFVKLLILTIGTLSSAFVVLGKMLLAEKDRQIEDLTNQRNRWEQAAWERREIVDEAVDIAHRASSRVATPRRTSRTRETGAEKE